MNIFTKFILLIFLVFITNCDAPRTNPLDPESPDNILTQISGSVKTTSLPRRPLEDVMIFWVPTNQYTITNANGDFNLEDIKKIDGWIIFDKPGFSTDSVFVNWADQSKLDLSIFLNEIPKLDSIVIASSVLNKYPALQAYSLEFKLKISDAESDIDSVFISSTGLNIWKNMNFNSAEGIFENSFDLDDLNLNSIEETVGKQFDVIVKDKNEKWFNLGSSIVKRIIKEKIIFESPANNSAVTIPFELKWKRFLPGFPFNYKIQIFSNDVPAELVFEINNVHADSIKSTITESLLPGDYFWVIWCIDEFENKSRSKPATFTIQ